MVIPYVIEGSGDKERVYDIYSRLLKDRIIYIQGEFKSDMANIVVAQLLYLNSYDNDSDIYMYINSPGGEVESMLMIYDTMRYIKPDINTIGIGGVSSAASFILASGTKGKRSALKNSTIMIHELSAGFSGKNTTIQETAKRTKKLNDKLLEYMSIFTGKEIKKLKKDMSKDYFMSSSEALEYGIIDKII